MTEETVAPAVTEPSEESSPLVDEALHLGAVEATEPLMEMLQQLPQGGMIARVLGITPFEPVREFKLDPERHVRKMERWDNKAKKNNITEYLDIKWRILMAKSAHPDWALRTAVEKLDLDNQVCVCRSVVVKLIPLPDGSVYEYELASDVGSESATDWKDYIEKAATKSQGRALIKAGFGIQFSTEFNYEDDAEAARKSYTGDSAGVEPRPPARNGASHSGGAGEGTSPQASTKDDPEKLEKMLGGGEPEDRLLDQPQDATPSVWLLRISGYHVRRDDGTVALNLSKFLREWTAKGRTQADLTKLLGGGSGELVKYLSGAKAKALQDLIDDGAL